MNAYRYIVIASLFAASPAIATVGFPEERIWTSNDPFFAGDTVTISTIVHNSAEEIFTGVLEFRDKGVAIGTSTFAVVRGQASIVSLDWIVPEGEHEISASIISTAFSSSTPASASSTPMMTGILRRFAVPDTDRDGVGNDVDQDDDGDGIPDKEDESPLHSDPAATGNGTGLGSSDALVSRLPEPAGKLFSGAEDLRLKEAERGERFMFSVLDDLRRQFEGVAGTSSATSTSTGASGAMTGRDRDAGWREFIRSIDSGDLLKSPIDYVLLLSASAYVWIAGSPWTFYLFLFLIILFIVRIVSGAIFR
jgi:hypothetical protein